MNIPQNDSILSKALINLPENFREKIIQHFIDIKKRQFESQFNENYDSIGLSAGKFCESVLRFLQYKLTGSCIPFNKHIPNFQDECQSLLQLPASTGIESLRVVIPRALIFLYTMRGKRGIGHVGGDIEANLIDIETIIRVSDWIMCELLRLFYCIPLEEAQGLVDSLATKNIPFVWNIDGKKRILRKDFSYKQITLVLLYSCPSNSALVEELFEWSGHSKYSLYRNDVIRTMHKSRLLEFNEEEGIVYLSPTGVKEAENILSL